MIKLATTVDCPPLDVRLSLHDRILVLGSCFADNIGDDETFVKSAVENPDEPDSDLPSWTVKYMKPLAKATSPAAS